MSWSKTGIPRNPGAWITSVRAELLARLGRTEEARAEFTAAASLARNRREREVLKRRAVSP